MKDPATWQHTRQQLIHSVGEKKDPEHCHSTSTQHTSSSKPKTNSKYINKPDYDNVYVWNHRTGRVIGNARDFRIEIREKYGLVSDLTMGALKTFAQENMFLFSQRR